MANYRQRQNYLRHIDADEEASDLRGLGNRILDLSEEGFLVREIEKALELKGARYDRAVDFMSECNRRLYEIFRESNRRNCRKDIKTRAELNKRLRYKIEEGGSNVHGRKLTKEEFYSFSWVRSEELREMMISRH